MVQEQILQLHNGQTASLCAVTQMGPLTQKDVNTGHAHTLSGSVSCVFCALDCLQAIFSVGLSVISFLCFSFSDWRLFLQFQPNPLIVHLDLIRSMICWQPLHKWLIWEGSISIFLFSPFDKALAPPVNLNKGPLLVSATIKPGIVGAIFHFESRLWRQTCLSRWQILFWFVNWALKQE